MKSLYRASRNLPLTAGALISVLFLAGCASFGAGKIRLPGVAVNPVRDAGSPAVASTSEAGVSVALPQGSRLVISEINAIPATNETPAQPAKKVTEVIPGGPTAYVQKESTISASSGTVDTSVAKKRVDAEESRPLLYGAILAALAAGFFVYRAYPTPAICCGAASVVFFLSWRMADLPPWVAALGLAAIAGGVALWLGHKRGLCEPVPEDKK